MKVTEVWFIPKPGTTESIKLGIELLNEIVEVVATIPAGASQTWASLPWLDGKKGNQRLWSGAVEATAATLFYGDVSNEGHKLLIKGPDGETSVGIPKHEVAQEVLTAVVPVRLTNWLAWLAVGAVAVGLLWPLMKRRKLRQR